jgi:hypothetical protein
MPTKPVDAILDRNFAIVAAQPVIERASPLLKELVGFSINLLVRSDRSAKGGQDEDLAPLSMFHTAIGLLDGVQILVSNAAANAALPVLRSLNEISMQLWFMLSDPQLYKQRALSWVVFRTHEILHAPSILDPNTDEGAAFEKVKEQDEIAANILLPPREIVIKSRQRYDDLLKKPHLQHIELEYNRKKFRYWFQMFGGPANLRELAKHLKMGVSYEFEYRDLSRHVHGIKELAYESGSGGGSVFRSLHGNLDDLRDVAYRATLFSLRNIRATAEHFRKGENLKSWYVREIKEDFEWLRELTGLKLSHYIENINMQLSPPDDLPPDSPKPTSKG